MPSAAALEDSFLHPPEAACFVSNFRSSPPFRRPPGIGSAQRAMHAEKAEVEFSAEHVPEVDESGNVMLMARCAVVKRSSNKAENQQPAARPALLSCL